MSAYLIGTLLTWVGYAALLGSIYQLVTARRGLVMLLLGSLALTAGASLAPARGIQVPLVWIVMPFTAWMALASFGMVCLRGWQAATALQAHERAARLKAMLAWLAAAAVGIAGYLLDESARIQIFKGGIPLSLPAAIGVLSLAIATIMLMAFTARALRARETLGKFAIHGALIAGSIVFGLPFAWLTLTSFKEDIDMSSPDGIVWVPKVQQTVPYFSKDNPLYSTKNEDDVEVVGPIIQHLPGGKVRLDVLQPRGLRGTTAEAPRSELVEVSRPAPLVTVRNQRGVVIEEKDDGSRVVQTESGARLTVKPGEYENVRTPGLRTENYSDALDFLPAEAEKGLAYLRNTVLIVTLTVLGTILSSAIVAYAFSRLRFPGRDILFTVMLATMMLPGAVTKLPQFLIFKQLGWIDTLLPLWVPAFFGSAFNIFMLRQFFRQIPMELEDAAKIDGAGYLRTFWSVMLPQIKPALAVITIWTVVGGWNDFLNPLIYISSPEKMTISYAVQLFSADRAAEPGLVAAFTMMSMAPVLLLFFFTQRYFIEGVTLSGMGGR